jgi:hypothetical protein
MNDRQALFWGFTRTDFFCKEPLHLRWLLLTCTTVLAANLRRQLLLQQRKEQRAQLLLTWRWTKSP